MTQHIVAVANAIRGERYPDAAAVFAAGSIVRGEGTAFSDLDLVIVHGRLDRAYRESFRYDRVPVEAFVHDPETLEYFFQEVDRPSGVPALAHMVFEGIEIPGANDLSRILKDRAASFIAAGPPALDAEGERRLRYVVTDLLDDLRGAQSDDDRVAIGSRLYEQLADYYFRNRGWWSAKGKAIPRLLRQADAELCEKYCRSFEALFKAGESGAIIGLAEELLRASGGPLFEGYRADAPPAWRKARS